MKIIPGAIIPRGAGEVFDNGRVQEEAECLPQAHRQVSRFRHSQELQGDFELLVMISEQEMFEFAFNRRLQQQQYLPISS